MFISENIYTQPADGSCTSVMIIGTVKEFKPLCLIKFNQAVLSSDPDPCFEYQLTSLLMFLRSDTLKDARNQRFFPSIKVKL